MTLDDALALAEAALPEGWIIRSLYHDGMTWDAKATPYGKREGIVGMGDTAADALRELARVLGTD